MHHDARAALGRPNALEGVERRLQNFRHIVHSTLPCLPTIYNTHPVHYYTSNYLTLH